MHRIALAFVAAFAVAGAAAWLWLPRAESAPAAAEAAAGTLLPVETFVVELDGDYPVTESYAGRVVSRRRSALGFERGGRLERVWVDEGDTVEPGQVLAVLDTSALEAQRRQLEAQQRETEARLALARLTTERRRKLRESDHVSVQEMDEAIFAERALEASLAAARASLERVEVDLELSRIEAPYAGTVTERLEDEGTVVAPGQPLLGVVEAGALEVHVGVRPETAAELVAGARYEVEIAGARHAARLDSVLPTIEIDTRTVTVILRLDAAAPGVRSGALARVALERRVRGEGSWLPLTALAESRRGLWSAYAVVSDGEGGARVERRQLELIHAEADRAYVRGTLRAGDRLVATGLHRLVPGQRVRLAEAAPRAAVAAR
ncbi:MAG: efflux RND transporter periplasmic adaptor subunit [Myxococcota bacterium]|nr:efflux RND transporter periplasmic adaptor subunit [Myxococcota bacterium]